MESVKIVAVCILCAVTYGILHDQITARICVEYFTIGHPPVFGTEDPTLLGIGWGVIATWWVGLILGVPLALASRFGRRPKLSARSLVRPLVWLMGVSALIAVAAGTTGWALASLGYVNLAGYLAEAIPAERHVAFVVDGFAHTASYAAAFVGGLTVIVRAWWSRRRLRQQNSG